MDTIDGEVTAPLLDGRYRLDGCVGRGGTSMVYRAHDTLLRRTVAIKLLRADDEMPLESERIHSETALLASLSHPSLVALYDASLDLPHPRYLVMEFIDGPTLATHLTRGPLSRREAAAIGRDLADALRVVHQRGIVHRDVKPSNVLLARADGNDGWTAKLTDFGIAYHPDEARRTSPGIAIGTAAYMAPEQVRADPITPAADIYSLGLVLLESLTGEPAFPRTRDVQTALARLVSAPSIPDELGAEWAQLLRRMTHSEPDQRPTAAEVVHEVSLMSTDARDDTTGVTKALPAVSIATPVAPKIASATTPDVQERRPVRRRTMGLFAAAAAAAAVLAGGWMASPAGTSPTPTATPAQVAETPAAPDADQPVTTPIAETPVEPVEPVQPASPVQPAQPAESEVKTAGSTTGENASGNPNAGPGNNSGSSPETNSGKAAGKSDSPQGNGNGNGNGK
ncbi:protein kinase [Microbacterium sp. NPDC089987]|uniref:serine/threonine-protein kinase n=1 Tax=Microbacterium sp. NPDC089987 TaxID=3364202 RepID=UPI003820AD2D